MATFLLTEISCCRWQFGAYQRYIYQDQYAFWNFISHNNFF